MKEILSRTNTQALKGFAAIGIFVFHIILAYDISPVFNMWGGLFVAVFLILSGYGLEESYREKGLDGYWRKRLKKVVLPFVFFVCAYNYLFSFLLPKMSMHRCLDELLYIIPSFWFVFFILECYVVYWIGTRFMPGRLRCLFFVVCSLVCLNIETPSGHLEAEQSFSFLAGVFLSRNKHRLEALPTKEMCRWTLLLLFIGTVFFCLKAVPTLHELKGSIAYNYMLCPFRLTTGLVAIPLLTMLRLGKSRLMQTSGRYSLEIYIAHTPFIGLIAGGKGTAVFIACSVVAFFMLLIYRQFVENKLGIAEVLFIVVNALFVEKYSARVFGDASLYVTLTAIVCYYVLLRLVIPYYIYRNKGQETWSKRIAWGICLLAFVGMVAVQYAVEPYSIQVDRWSALHFPIRNLLLGIYPYSASTHLGGYASPFPVWQILHIPFYLMGNVGLSFFASLALFIWSCWKIQGRDNAFIVSLLLCSSVAVWYEVAVRSDLITNLLLVAAIINLVSQNLSQQWVKQQRWWIACVVGLLASTRILVLVPLAVLFLPYLLRMNLRRQCAVMLLSATVFALTFVPFALWDWQEFYHFQNNPWALQASQGHLSDFIIFVPLALYLAMTHNGNAFRYYRNSAMMLAAFVIVTFVHNMYLGANWDLFSPTYDITYLSSVLPFCLLAFAEKDDV